MLDNQYSAEHGDSPILFNMTAGMFSRLMPHSSTIDREPDMSKTNDNKNMPEEDSAENIEALARDAQDLSNSEENDVQRLSAENAELKDRILRVQAELENFRRRTQKEALDAIKYQSIGIIRDMLPGIDNLKRAIDVTEETGDTQQLLDGIKMVFTQFQDALKSHSCEQIDPDGKPFDANYHEALAQVPSADHAPMTVLQVIEQGYKIHDRIVRPAKVMVTCAPPSDPPDSVEA